MVDTPRVEQTADVAASAVLGPGTTVWHLAQVRENARLGNGCIVGRGAYVGPGVVIGDNVKLQNYALVYEPARLEDGVFIGPAAVLTNDLYPRSVDVTGKLKRSADWDANPAAVGRAEADKPASVDLEVLAPVDRRGGLPTSRPILRLPEARIRENS